MPMNKSYVATSPDGVTLYTGASLVNARRAAKACARQTWIGGVTVVRDTAGDRVVAYRTTTAKAPQVLS